MLKPHTPDTFITDKRQRQNAFAFCTETGANLIKSRRHPWYALIVSVDETTEMRHLWHRKKVLSDQAALARAQWTLNRMMKNRQESEK